VRCWPVIVRELREQARRPLNHWVRTLGAVALVALTFQMMLRPLLMAWTHPVFGTILTGSHRRLNPGDRLDLILRHLENRGGVLFAVMNLTLLATIWLVGPLLTADCLSRERRDGTLGLLFLTPLKPADIVLAKLAAHGFRAVCVFLGALPVLMLPLLVGGVSWMDALRAALLDLGALILALTAGLLASSHWQGPRAVLFGAVSVAVLCALVWVSGWVLMKLVAQNGIEAAMHLPAAVMATLSRALQRLSLSLSGPSFLSPWAGGMTGATAVTSPRQLIFPAALLLIAVTLARAVFHLASRGVARAQREGAPWLLRQRAEAWLGEPRVLRDWWALQQRRLLEWNPILWSEVRTWRLRVAPWLTLLGMVLVETWWVDEVIRQGGRGTHIPWLVLSLLTAFTAASSLQRERATGGLELVLTTPAGARTVLGGKLGALAIQSVPAGMILIAVDLVLARQLGVPLRAAVEGIGLAVPLVARLALLTAAGAYFSLKLRAFVPALIATLAVGIAAEFLAGSVQDLSQFPARGIQIPQHQRWLESQILRGLLEGSLALAFVFLLHRALARRSFAAP
jgi:ABC-type transport system involved in multi-copper enzyme maturation permease subunit